VKRLAMTILWPAFLMAGVLEVLVFAVVDPGELHWFGGAAGSGAEPAGEKKKKKKILGGV